jgi:archaellum component FlaC
MIMAESTITTGVADDRLVTVSDLRYELERERRITDAHFANVLIRIEAIHNTFDQRFEQVDKGFEQIEKQFEQVDRRFEQVDKRFEQVDKRFDRIDARFDALDERLRSNKTLLILAVSTASSIASVVISLLK